MNDAAPTPAGEQGCLTDHDVEALRHAPPGSAPPALALHLAGCTRCQERLLSVESLRRPDTPPPSPPQPARLIMLLLLLLFGACAALYSIRWMIGF